MENNQGEHKSALLLEDFFEEQVQFGAGEAGSEREESGVLNMQSSSFVAASNPLLTVISFDKVNFDVFHDKRKSVIEQKNLVPKEETFYVKALVLSQGLQTNFLTVFTTNRSIIFFELVKKGEGVAANQLQLRVPKSHEETTFFWRRNALFFSDGNSVKKLTFREAGTAGEPIVLETVLSYPQRIDSLHYSPANDCFYLIAKDLVVRCALDGSVLAKIFYPFSQQLVKCFLVGKANLDYLLCLNEDGRLQCYNLFGNSQIRLLLQTDADSEILDNLIFEQLDPNALAYYDIQKQAISLFLFDARDSELTFSMLTIKTVSDFLWVLFGLEADRSQLVVKLIHEEAQSNYRVPIADNAVKVDQKQEPADIVNLSFANRTDAESKKEA